MSTHFDRSGEASLVSHDELMPHERSQGREVAGLAGDVMAAARPRLARTPTEGAQSIRRAASIIRIVGGSGRRGALLKDIVAACGLHKATAHRMLGALAEEGMIDHDPVNGRYRLGIELSEMSAIQDARPLLKDLAGPSMDRLSAKAEDTVYLSIRSGYDGLCLDMREGAYPIKALRLRVNDRWPLGMGAFTIPLMAYLPDAEVDAIIAHNAPRSAAGEAYAGQQVRPEIGETRRLGYCLRRPAAYPVMCGLGVAVLDRHGRAIASLCVTAIVGRLEGERLTQVIGWMDEEARTISELWDRAS